MIAKENKLFKSEMKVFIWSADFLIL